MKRRDPEQLNRPDVSDQGQLEDDTRVYTGSSSRPGKPSGDTMTFRPVSQDTATFRKGDTATFRPVSQETAAFRRGDTAAFRPVSHSKTGSSGKKGDTAVFQPVRDSSAKTRPFQPVDDLPENDLPKKKPSQAEKAAAQAPTESSPVEYSPHQLLKKYHSGLLIQHIRLYLLALIALFSVFLLLYQVLSGSFFPGLEKYGSTIALSALGLSLLLAVEVPIRGVLDLLHARISTYTLTTLAVLLGVIQGITALSATVQTYCLPLLLLLYFHFYSLVANRSGMFHTLRTVCSFDSPMGIYDTPKLLPNTDSLHRSPADMKDYIQNLLRPDFPQKVLCVYSTLLLPVTMILAVLFAVRTNTNFLLLWLLLLTCSVPCTGMLAYAVPSRVLAKRLSGFGGALCGWHSAKLFGGKHTLILRDEDLFPSADCSSNGMKLFNGYRAEEVIPLALAAVELVDSPLTGLFRSLLTAPLRKPLQLTDHRVYENNGIGAEIDQNVVLVGTLSFMRSMGVHMPAGTRVRQAVYVSVNGELAGIFAIRYRPNPSTGSGLKEVLSNRNFSVVLATRDFLITPELIAAKYELPVDSLIYPKYTERLRLSEKENAEISSQGALIAKDTFGAFAMTVAAGRTLRITARTGLWMNLFAGLFGLLLCSLLIVWGSVSAVSPIHLAAFQLLWAGVTLLISYILLKF